MSDIEPTVATLSEFSDRDLKHYSVIILCNVRDLAIGVEARRQEYAVRCHAVAGHGLAVGHAVRRRSAVVAGAEVRGATAAVLA